MRIRPAAVLLAALAVLPIASVRAAQAAPDAPADQLRFANRETMTGDFLGFTAGKGLRFRHGECEGDLLVRTRNLDTVTFRQTAAAAPVAGADWRVTLANGDSVAGKLVAFSPEKITLDTASAGRLEIATAAVAGLTPLASADAPGVIFGVGKAEDWKGAKGIQPVFLPFGNGRRGPGRQDQAPQPQIKDGQLHVPDAGATRALGMKAQSRLDMTLEGSPSFMVEFASGPPKEGKEVSYALHVFSGHAMVTKLERKPGFSSSSTVEQFDFPTQDGPAVLSFLADAKGNHLAVAVDGRKIGNIAMPVETAGQQLTLRSDDPTRAIRLTHLTLVPGATDFAEGGAARGATDSAALANGDRMNGTLLAIADGKASFKTEVATLDLPLARLRGITFSAGHNLAQAVDADTVRIHWNNADRLTLKVAEIKDGVLTGTAAGLGQAALKVGAAQRLEFNPGAQMESRMTLEAGRGGAKPNDAKQGGVGAAFDAKGAMKLGGVQLQVFGIPDDPDAPDAGLRQLPPEVLRQLNQQLNDKNLIPEIRRQLLKEGLVTTEEEKVEEEGKEGVQPPKPAPAPGK